MSAVRNLLLVYMQLVCFAHSASSMDDPITEREAREFATALSAAVETMDARALDELIDATVPVREIVKDIEFLYRDKDRWIENIENGLKAQPPVETQLLALVGSNTSYDLVSVDCQGTEWRIVMRLLTTDGVFGYNVLHLARANDETVRATRLSSIGAAGDPSAFVKHIVARYASIETEDGKLSNDAPNAEELRVEKAYAFEIIKRFREADYIAVYKTWKQGPVTVCQNPLVAGMILRSVLEIRRATIAQGQEEAEEATETIIADLLRGIDFYGIRDANIDLQLLDYQIHTGKPEQALQSIAAIRNIVGDDPYLRLTEARALLANGDREKSLQIAKVAFSELQNVPYAYLDAAELHASAGEFDRVIKIIEQMQTRFNLTVDERRSNFPGWQAFFASDQYENWKVKQTAIE